MSESVVTTSVVSESVVSGSTSGDVVVVVEVVVVVDVVLVVEVVVVDAGAWPVYPVSVKVIARSQELASETFV